MLYDLGLNEYEIKRMLHEHLDSNPDLKYYIQDEYIVKAIDLLIDGIADVIAANNKEIAERIERRSIVR